MITTLSAPTPDVQFFLEAFLLEEQLIELRLTREEFESLKTHLNALRSRAEADKSTSARAPKPRLAERKAA